MPDEATRQEAEDLLGPGCVFQPLTYGRRLGITRSAILAEGPYGSAVAKVLGPSADDPTPLPPDFRWWRREVEFYLQGGAPPAYRSAGIRSPDLLAAIDRPDGTTALWLERLQNPGTGWRPDDYREPARRLGCAQGAMAAKGDHPDWSSRHFLRSYIDSWEVDVDYELLGDDGLWSHPLAEGGGLAPSGLGQRLLRMHADSDQLLAWVQSGSPTLCHLDWWPANLFRGPEDSIDAIDWGLAGTGALGEDPGNLVPEAAFDLWLPPDELGAVDRVVTSAYLEGLAATGWPGDLRRVRLAMCASAVKYVWLGPMLLARMEGTAQEADGYGGVPQDARRQFAARWATLDYLTRWVDEARSLAKELAGRL